MISIKSKQNNCINWINFTEDIQKVTNLTLYKAAFIQLYDIKEDFILTKLIYDI